MNYDCNPRPELKSSGSIDDFLANYRHESSSIVSFLSCLEKPEISGNHLNSTTKQPRSSQISDRLPKVSSQPSSATLSTMSFLTSGVVQETLTTKSPKQPRKVKQVETSISARPRTGDESEQERKRRKNREYQQRFREKKMRLQLQRQTSTAAPLENLPARP